MAKSLIKKLSKAEIAEGLTLELVNSIRMDRNYSPVQLLPGDEPTHLLQCSTGYWVMVDGQALKDEKNQLIVWKLRECQVGRARYLLNFGAQEKENKVQALMASWKKEVKEKIDEVEKVKNGFVSGFTEILSGAIEQMRGKEFSEAFHKDREERQKNATQLHDIVQRMWAENKIIELLEFFKIKTFPNPMLSVRMDNEQEIKVMKNTFGAEALNEWDGDMLYKYAQIEIEKQYPI